MSSASTIVITGSNKGIGRAILKKFANEYSTIWACSRTMDQKIIDENKEIAEKNNITIENIFFDLTNKDELKQAAKEILSKSEKIDVLINNAGTIDTSLFQMTNMSKIRQLFEVNFFGQLEFTQMILKKMIKSKNASVIFISSTAATDPAQGRLSYSSSKSAINIAAKILSHELSRFKIRVNTIAPGLTNTDMMNNNHSDENIKTQLEKTSYGRVAEPNEIASLALYLASNKSSYINGQIIRIDGGI